MTNWSSKDIPDQQGRTVVITGANSGLGEQAAKALGAAGATVILACRTVDKAKPVASAIGPNASVAELDLADLASVRRFADGIDTVDVLINNAGVMAVPKKRTADGFEMQFGTNHLGHFALTGLLLPKITDRVVTVSSFAHILGKIDLDDLNYDHRRYERWSAYGQSKLANLLFGFELARKLGRSGSAVSSMVAHPGYATTGLQSHTQSIYDRIMKVTNLVGQSAADGALPELYAAASPDAASGAFYGPSGFGGMRGAPTLTKAMPKARDEGVAQALWIASEKLTGVTYGI
ncbi:oxidoreductase [Williamsia maris]|uniref:NAD(P)-dependent dehydrogenase, short-chain alcohol dehydrogenase family n=1 Tax=Williamsia maris TaxID=72806 RepID=A0ABT1H9H0_9NOCA|nr:oxidoreductase [Williamsia maris]MCP2174906.1 NAD(P)-dependent dehydrogenase, short-chain alcohol dehydrogenase family [Williamsia maris]